MSIVYRQELGRELTWSEADNNFAELKAGVDSKKSNFDVLPVTQGGTGQTTVDAVKVAFDIATKTELASSAAGKGAELVANAARRYATIAEMKAAPAPARKTVVCVEEYAAGYGPEGGGNFYWSPTSNETENGVTVFTPDSAPANGRWKRSWHGELNIKQAGAKMDGSTEDRAALFKVAALTAVVRIPAGRLAINADGFSHTELAGLSGIRFVGSGPQSVIYFVSGDLRLKSPSGVVFENLAFEANPVWNDAASPGNSSSIWASNYNGLTFLRCKFSGFGGTTTPLPSSACLWLYAGPTSTKIAGGNSTGARVLYCDFDGGERDTNFAVRVYTEWGVGASLDFANTDTLILGSTFKGFNWNAVESVGPMTSGSKVIGCTANACGLVPFDIDKGAHDCIIDDVIINRLLGNKDTAANPSTRACVVSIQGQAEVGGRISRNNRVTKVVANLLAADIEARTAAAGFSGFSAVALSGVKDSEVENVTVTCDRVPVENTAAQFAFAMLCYESASGCKVRDVETRNASAGIVEVRAHLAEFGEDANIFRDLRNIGVGNAEAICINKSSAATNRVTIDGLVYETDMSKPIDVSSALIALRSTVAAPGYVSVKNSYLKTPGFSICFAFSPVLALENTEITYAGGTGSVVNLFQTGSTVGTLYLDRVTFNGAPIDLSVALTRVPSTCAIRLASIKNGTFGSLPTKSDALMFSSAAPTNPAIANWASPTMLYNLNPTLGGKIGWVNYGGGMWKAFGAIDA